MTNRLVELKRLILVTKILRPALSMIRYYDLHLGNVQACTSTG